MEKSFRKFDTSNDGKLTLAEFKKAVEPFGYSEVAHIIFDELDRDGSGSVTYTEILVNLKRFRETNRTVSADLRRLLTAMSFSETATGGEPEAPLPEVDTTPFTCENSHELADILRERSKAANDGAGARPFDIWRLLLAKVMGNGGQKYIRIPRKQFHQSVRVTFGFEGERGVLDQAVNHMDDDNNDMLTCSEFMHWLRGEPSKKQIAKGLTLSSEGSTSHDLCR